VLNRFVQVAMLLGLMLLAFSAQAATQCSTISLAPDTLPSGTAGTAYGPVTFTASGSAATPFGYQITSGLPAGSGLNINPGSGVLSGTPNQSGTFLLTITATDQNGCTGGRTYQVDIGVGNQTINFTSTAPAAATVAGATYTATATATSGLPVTLTIDATAASVCSISGSTVSFQSVGTCVIDANQSGNASFNAAPQVQQSFAVGQGNQTITFTSTAPANATVGGPTYNVTATATSGLPVTFTIDAAAASVCSIVGSTVSFNAMGNCVIDANQAGDTNWNAAPQAQQTFGVGKTNQTISFTSTAPAGAIVAGPTYTVTATATSGLTVTFTIDATASSVCSISGSTVSFQSVGTCVIDANQAGDTTYNAAPQVQQSFAVGKGSQTLSFTSTAPAAATVGGATYTVSATSTAGLTVALTIDASAASICSISGSTVSFTAVGTCVIDANQAGNANYNAATQIQQSFSVGQGSQTISFTSTAPAGATVAGPTYTVSATATSGLPVTLTIDATATSVCSIAGSTVSFQSVGTCVIDANQAGNANYTAAPQVSQSFAVGKGNQTISFTSLPPASPTVGGPTYTVSATATSGLPVVFTIDASAASVCSIAGATVSFQSVGTCVIDADQPGDANYNPAPQAMQSFAVGKGDQTITFTSTAPAAATVGGATYNVTATATSGLAVTFTIDASATSICTISGSTVSFIAVGNCVIDADQAGDTNWNAAPQAQQSFTVGQGSQTISFTSTAPATAKVGGTTYNVTATATSGLPVTFTIDATATSVCSITGSTVSFQTVGTCKIDANQAGNANYTAAPQAQQTFSVAKGDQTITFTSTPPPGVKVNDAAYTVTATSSSGLAVTFSLDASSTGCALAGSSVTFPAGGTCVIDANQSGNGNYNAAPQAQQSFVVAKLDQTISFTSTAPAGAQVGGATYTVTATSTSGLAVTFSAGSTACTVAGSTVSFVHAATCTVNADQAGNAQYNPAPQAQQSFAVAKGDQTISFSTTAPTFGSATAAATPHTYNPAATATSTLTVTFSTAGACSFASPTVTFGPGAGTCTINADQAGNADWNAAPQVQQSTTVEIPATALGDGHNVTGNVAIAAGTSVMSNDSGTNIAIKSYGATTGTEQTSIGSATLTAQGGSVTLVAAGTYNYDPPANFTGTDTFKYIIGNDLVATSTGTVTLTITDRIMIVATAGVGAADCKRATACVLSTADSKAAPTGIDLVFVQSGGYTNPNSAIALNANQKLVGNFVSLGQAITDAGITLAAESVGPTAIAASATPTLSNTATAITLGGGNLVEYFSITNSAGSAILGNVAGSGTSTIHDITVTDGGNGGSGVTVSANVGTLNFSNLVVTTSSGSAFAATGGGSTINVTTGSTPNTLTSTTGTALNVTNTTIGASGMTFRSITSNGSGTNNGIILDGAGTGGLTVTGNGGTCTSAATCTGGTISNKTGADGNAQGTGVFVNNTSNVSLTRMQFNDFTNYAIRGTNVTGFNLSNSNFSGANGNNVGADEGTIIFDGLFGTSTFSGNTVTGTIEDNFRVRNNSGTLTDLIITGSAFLNAPNDNIILEPSGTAVMTAHVTNNTFTGAGGDHLQTATTNTANLTIVFTGNFWSNGFPGSLGGGITISGGNAGSAETVKFNVSNNGSAVNPLVGTVQGGAININEGNGAGNWQGAVKNNFIGNPAIANSGAAQSSGIRVENHSPSGVLTAIVDGNNVRQWDGGPGINFQVGDTGNVNAALNLTVTNNAVNTPGTLSQHGIVGNFGADTNGTNAVCDDTNTNNINLGNPAPNGGASIRLRQRNGSTVRLPGYGGGTGPGDTAGVITFESGQNTLNAGGSVTASAAFPVTGGGFLGGAACVQPTVPN